MRNGPVEKTVCFVAGLALGILLTVQTQRMLSVQTRRGHHPDYTLGALEKTGHPFHLAIAGRGYFQFTMLDGRTGYSRLSEFSRDDTGSLVGEKGFLLSPQISTPQDFEELRVDLEGSVTIVSSQQNQQIGQIQLCTFPNSDGLQMTGGGYLVETNESGPPTMAIPGTDGSGLLLQGYRLLRVVPESMPENLLVNGPYLSGVNDRHQEPLIHTGRDLDYAIEGRGFVEVELPTGHTGYTRYLSLNPVTGNDFFLRKFPPMGPIHLGLNLIPNETKPANLPLHLFPNPEKMHYFINGIYLVTEETGLGTAYKQGENGAGVLKQGYLNQVPRLEP